jgi:orotate phosphoribosyltransferase
MDRIYSPDYDLRIERQKLIEDLKSFSLKTGEEFILASGQKSNTYIDVKQTMLLGVSMTNLAKLLWEHSRLFGRYDMVAGVPMGGSHLATMVAMYSSPMNVVMIRKDVKDHGLQKSIEAPILGEDKNVVLFEDVVTTGQSVIRAAQILEQHNLCVKGIVAVVDRRVEKSRFLEKYQFISLVDFEELIEDSDAKESKQVPAQETRQFVSSCGGSPEKLV